MTGDKGGKFRGLRPLISRQRIARRLTEMAGEIESSISARERPIAVVVLQGAFIFAADLLRRFSPGFQIDVAFLRCQSYGGRTTSSGQVLLLQDIESDVDLHGRTVLLIDDILDTGLTVNFLLAHLRKRGAARVKLCVLLERDMTQASRLQRPKPDFAGFRVGPEFVVGYGLDCDGRYRQLPDLAILKPKLRRARRRAVR